MSTTEIEQTTQTFWDHLMELKNTLLWCAGFWIAASIGCALFSDSLLGLIMSPLGEYKLNFFSPSDSLMFLLKIYAFSGFIVSLPAIIFITGRYIRTALKPTERRFLFFYSIGMFFPAAFGLVYGYLFLVPASLQMLLELTPANTSLVISANEYINFLVSLLGLLILIFQTPVIVFSLIRFGLVTPEGISSKRKMIYFALVVVLAILTPPDILSLVLTAVPVIVLFEASLILSRIGLKKTVGESEDLANQETVQLTA